MRKFINPPIFQWRAAVLATVLVLAITIVPAMADSPIANFTATPISGNAPLAVQFIDGSTGENITGWAWDFDNNGVIDNTTSNPSFTYVVAGTYSVNLTVTNSSGSSSTLKTDYITVNATPAALFANFTANVTFGTVPLPVHFTDESTGAPTAWLWDFGDGTNSTDKNATHTYSAPGSYTVNLTVGNAGGSDSLLKENLIVVTAAPTPPIANFSANVTSGTPPLTVQFSDRSTGTPTSWSWTFGSGGTSPDQNPIHTYTTAGTYTVNLTVSNAGGSDSEEKAAYIEVTAPAARTWTVGVSGCDFANLNSAFSNPSLNDGDTIFVNAGVYPLSTSLSKAVTLQGAGPDAVTVNPSSVTISGTGIRVEDLKFSGGTLTFSGTDTLVTDCTFTAFSGQNSVTFSGQHIVVENSTFSDNPNRFLRISGNDHVFVNNTFTNSGSSSSMTRFESCSNVTITRNSFVGNKAAPIGLRSTLGNNKIYLNNFVNNPVDVYVYTNTPLPEPITWVSQPITYTYLGTEHTGPLGNYYSSYTGTDADGNGVIDSPRTLYSSPAQVDNAPLADRVVFYYGGEHGVTSVIVSPASSTVNVTNTLQFVATAYEMDGIPASGRTFTWSSSNVTVGPVNSTGFFTAVAPGVTYITAETGGFSGTATVTVLTPAIQAAFTAAPVNGEVPLSVQFTDTSVGPGISAWAWDFENDGIIDNTTRNPAHMYSSAGNYSVNLTVTGLGGKNSLVKENYIDVYERQAVVAWGSIKDILGDNIQDIGAGADTAFGIRADRSLVQWGTSIVLPVGNDFIEVHGGESTVCAALRENGTVVPFGNTLLDPPSGNDFVTISIGKNFGVGIRSNETLETWGSTNSYQQLDAPSGNDYIAVSAKGEHALALKSDGSIVAWGKNTDLQCNVPEGNDFIAISAGYSTSLALRANHTVVGWGKSSYGGRSPTGSFTAIEAGRYDSFAIRPDGSIYQWGRGDLNNIPAGNDYIDIAAGKNYAIALRNLEQGPNPLTADFFAGPTSGPLPLTVHFVDRSAGLPFATSWAWDLNGDGSVDSTSQCTEFTYTLPGTYSVSLTVENNATNNSLTKNGYITVFSRPTITASPEGGTYSTPPNVTLSAVDPYGSVNSIYYTLDGTDPQSSGTRILYSAPFSFETTTSVKYAAVNTERHWSAVGITNYVISGLLHLADTAKPKFQHDNKNTGQSPYTGPQTATLLWNYTTGKGVFSSPVIGTDGTIYVGSWDNNVYAINPNGTVKWSYPTGKAVWSTPALDTNGAIYVGSEDNNFYAINRDGTLKWNYTTAGNLPGSAAIGADGTIVIGEYGSNVYCFYPDGTLKWKYSDILMTYSSPAIGADGSVYIGAEGNSQGTDNNLYAINPDGTLKWKYDAGSVLRSSPSIGPDGTIYIGDSIGYLFAINPDGTLKWEYLTGNWIDLSTAAIGADGTLYIGSGDKSLHAINPDGSVKWQFATGNPILSSPAIGADGTIYFGSEDKNVYALNPDGTLKWNYTTGSKIDSSPAIAPDGTLYIGSVDFNLYAFRDPTGIPVANFTALPQSGELPLAVQFTDTSTGSPTSWVWDFGDGNTTVGQNPSHIYSSAGNFTVNLTVSNAMGSNSKVKTEYITVWEAPGPSVLPDYNNIFVRVANDAGVKYNAFGNHTYNIRFEGYDRGLNTLHVSTDPADNTGEVTVTDAQSGTFYATDSGNEGYEDEILLLVAVNGTIPEDFSLHITSDGYRWTPNPGIDQPPSPDNVTYQAIALDETFTKADFIYGPQTWKPTGNEVAYPLYSGQNMTDTENNFHLLFVDLNAGVLRPNASLTNHGAVRINYTFENLDTFAAFSVYAYRQNTNNGDNIIAWTNALTPDKTMSGYSVFARTSPVRVSLNPPSVTLLPGGNRQFTAAAYDDEGVEIPGASFNWASSNGAVGTINETGYFSALSVGTTSVNATTGNVSGTAVATVRNENTPTGGIIPASDDVYLKVSNALGAYFNDFGDDSFHILWTGGGLNSLHISDGEGDASGEVTYTPNLSGTFYVTTTGGRGYQDDIFLCAAVNGSIPEDFRIHLMTDGYVWTPNPIPHEAPAPENTSYEPVALDEWFTKDDLIYGSQTWRPAAQIQYPLFPNQNVSDQSNSFMMMFVDMNAGVLTDHPLRVRYEIENLTGMCAFNAYGYAQNANSEGDCVTSWTNRVAESAGSGWYVTSGPPDHSTLSIIPASNNLTIGSTTHYQLVMNTLPAGLSGYNITVSLDHPAVGEITAVSLPTWAALNGTSTLPADTVSFNAVDLNKQVEPGAANVLLGTVTVRADTAGTTGINVTVRKMDDDNGNVLGPAINDGQLQVFDPLVANFSAEPLSGYRPLAVNFTDLSTGNPLPTAWAWDFENDGIIDSSTQSPSHTYAASGTYTVNLTISNEYDTDSVVKATFVEVEVLVQAFPGYTNLPTDPDHDGIFEDVNGNGRLDFDDVVAYYSNMAWMSANTAVGIAPYDFNNNGRIDFDDVVVLYDEVLAG